ncbi:MAG: polymer-forming cytoskeletal protein [Ignavibacteriae bacterium]|nr:polymer-forming cytoskeletal protein [Ignavibacteriota bacterium]
MKNEPSAGINLIGLGTVLEGKLRSPGDIQIDGKVVGEITASQNISIGSSGDVEGNINARNITIGGKIKGTIIAQEKLMFQNKAVVRGDIRAAKLVIDEGALFDGNCSMGEAKQMPSVVELKPELRKAEGR